MKKNVLLTLILLFSAMCLKAQSSHLSYRPLSVPGHNYVVVAKCNTSATGTITVPSVCVLGGNSYEVIGIDTGAFKNCINITKVVLPNTLRSIQDSAFFSCTQLRAINMPDSLYYLGQEAFKFCIALDTIHSLGKITRINKGTFYACTSLSAVHLPSTLKVIDREAFNCARRMISITIPHSVDTIGIRAFAADTSLQSVQMSNNLKYLGNSAFKGCTSLQSIDTLGQLVRLESSVFAYCKALQYISLPSTLLTINALCFYRSGLSMVDIPDSVYNIGMKAFSQCDSLWKVVLPNNTLQINDSAFSDCSSLSEVYRRYPTPPSLMERTVFDGISEQAKLIVPCQSIPSYMSDTIWTTFFDTILPWGGDTLQEAVLVDICQGEVYDFGGTPLTSAGTYFDTLSSFYGCDSVVSLTLNVNPVFDTTIMSDTVYSDSEPSRTDTVVNTLQSVNGCDSTIRTINVVVNTSSLADIVAPQVDLFPNPAKDNIVISHNMGKAIAHIYDLQGREIKVFVLNSNKHTIDVSDLEQGVYNLVMKNNNKTINKRLVIK